MEQLGLEFRSVDGELRALSAELTDLQAAVGVNVPGSLSVSLAAGSAAGRELAQLAPGAEVRLWRQATGIGLGRTIFFRGGLLAWGWSWRGGGVLTVRAEGPLGRLGRRVVAWHEGRAGRTTFRGQPAETIMKALVRGNLGSEATLAQGRLLAGVQAGVSVAVDQGRGPRLDWDPCGENLLLSLQRLARVSGLDFDLAAQAGGGYTFEVFPGGWGADRSATVRFSLGRGNMGAPVWRGCWCGTAAAVVGGPDAGADRLWSVAKTGAYALGTNDGELFVSANRLPGAAARLEWGARALAEVNAEVGFTFEPRQTAACVFGVHYGLGDWVSAENPFNGAATRLQVRAAQLTQAGAQARLAVTLQEAA